MSLANELQIERPRIVLITGGHEVGGLTSFAEALSEGFQENEIPAEIISPSKIWSRWRELRDSRVLKILSTTAIFAAPFSRRTICVAHGFPTVGLIGWKKFGGHLIADHMANRCQSACVVTVSQYSAAHLRAVLGVRIDGVVPNALRRTFLNGPTGNEERSLITFAGRLHESKNVRFLLPAMIEVLEAYPDLRVCIIGDGPERQALQDSAKEHLRVEFPGTLDALALRRCLRATKVFISGCPTEALGITYLEALSQGCNVVMPASGGGLEVAPHLIGGQIQLMPLTLDRASVVAAIRRALAFAGETINVESYSPDAIASAYLQVDADRIRTSSTPDVRSSPPNLASAPLNAPPPSGRQI